MVTPSVRPVPASLLAFADKMLFEIQAKESDAMEQLRDFIVAGDLVNARVVLKEVTRYDFRTQYPSLLHEVVTLYGYGEEVLFMVENDLICNRTSTSRGGWHDVVRDATSLRRLLGSSLPKHLVPLPFVVIDNRLDRELLFEALDAGYPMTFEFSGREVYLYEYVCRGAPDNYVEALCEWKLEDDRGVTALEHMTNIFDQMRCARPVTANYCYLWMDVLDATLEYKLDFDATALFAHILAINNHDLNEILERLCKVFAEKCVIDYKRLVRDYAASWKDFVFQRLLYSNPDVAPFLEDTWWFRYTTDLRHIFES